MKGLPKIFEVITSERKSLPWKCDRTKNLSIPTFIQGYNEQTIQLVLVILLSVQNHLYFYSLCTSILKISQHLSMFIFTQIQLHFIVQHLTRQMMEYTSTKLEKVNLKLIV